MGVTAEGKIYSLYSSRDPRMVLRFGVKDAVLGIEEEIPFVIDTGATCVVLPAKDLYLGRQEEQLIKGNGEMRPHIGIASNVSIPYYRYNVSEFYLGDYIRLKDFPIHITFDPHATMKLVGMSFLKLFNIFIQPQYHSILFTAIPEAEQMVLGRQSAQNIEQLVIQQLSIEGMAWNQEERT